MQTIGIAVYNRMVSARYRARMEAVMCETGRCERLSTCYRTASALITKIICELSNSDDALVERSEYAEILIATNNKNLSLAGLSACAFGEVIYLLDGDNNLLSSRSRCNTLALATISEALLQAHSRSCLGYEAEMMARVIAVLEALESIIYSEYTGPAAPRDTLYPYLGKPCLLH
jgi:DhnA family fructose-bisphosphate aldolase class Ia